jgi:chorismate mutase / prephenate dehydratase
MTKIESKAIHDSAWESAFAIDVLGNAADAPVQAALEEISAEGAYVKILGSYPAAE